MNRDASHSGECYSMRDVGGWNGSNVYPYQLASQRHGHQDSLLTRQQANEGFSRGGQPPHPRMHFPPFSSTVGLACGSSPFNDTLPPVNSSPIHSGWMPHNPHYPRFHGVQPVFLPVERGNAQFHRPCLQPPSPCHMGVCNFCTRISCCGNSAFPKRPRLEGERYLPTLENGSTTSVFPATFQAAPQAHKTPLRTTRPPPPLVKTVQNGSHHRISAVHSSGAKTPQISPARNISGNNFKRVLSAHNGCLRDSIKYGDEVIQFRSNSVIKSSTALCKVRPQYFGRTSFEPTKRSYGNEVDKNNSTNSEQHNKIEKDATSSHDNIHNDTSISLNQAKKEWTEKRSRYSQSNTADTEKTSYSMRSEELLEHVSSSGACDQALDCMATREHVQQERQERCFAEPQEKRFVSRDGNQSGKDQSSDVKIKQHASVCNCCNESRSLLDIPKRRQYMPQNDCTPSAAPRDYEKEYPSTIRDNSYENSRATREKYGNYSALSPTGYHKCDTELRKQSDTNQQFTPPPKDKIAQCYPTTKADHQKCGDNPFKLLAPHFNLPESTVPQLRRGRPRTRGLKDKSFGYGSVPKYCLTSCHQSLPSKSFSHRERNMHTNDDHVFSASSCIDTNNNTRATDQIRYEPFVTNENSTTSVRNSEHEQQITRQPLVLDPQYDRNTNISDPSPVLQYQHFSSDKTHVKNIDRNRDRMGQWTHHDMSRDETTKVGNLLKSPKRESPCCDDSNFVTSLNELLKRRTDTSERQQRSNFSFDETQRKEVTLFQNKNLHTQSSQCEEERREATSFQCKRDVESVEENQKPTNSDCYENRRIGITGFPNKRTETRSLHRRVSEEDPGRSASRRLPIPNCEETESRDFKATAISSGTQVSNIVENKSLNDEVTDTSEIQQACRSSRAVPLPPDEDELDDMDSTCGGYAIDHSSLPKIVAVHSILKRDEIRGADQSPLTTSDKKYWNDVLKKLNSEMNNLDEGVQTQQGKPEMNPEVSTTSSLRSLSKESKFIDNQKQKEPSSEDKNFTLSPKKDSVTQPERLNDGKMNEGIPHWTTWEYLSTSSKNVTIRVRNPSAYAETERKTHLTRKKPTVAELSDKILVTRERIQKETIPWKKKLLHSLEAIFTKRLRKTEKETGEKASIPFEEEKAKEESKEKKNGQKERRNSQGGKEKIAAPRQKQTIKKKL